MNVLIDPGHGGSDTGCAGNGMVEKEMNLLFSLMLATVCRAYGITATLTRTTDVKMALSQRAIPGTFDLTLAVHCDISAKPEVGSMSCYVKHGDAVAYRAGLSVLKAAPYPLAFGPKQVTMASPDHWTYRAYNVLHNHIGPALLVETCFLSNAKHAAFIQGSYGKAVVVDCLFQGVLAAWDSRPPGA